MGQTPCTEPPRLTLSVDLMGSQSGLPPVAQGQSVLCCTEGLSPRPPGRDDGACQAAGARTRPSPTTSGKQGVLLGLRFASAERPPAGTLLDAVMSAASGRRSSFLPSYCTCHVQRHSASLCPFLMQPERTGGDTCVQDVIEKLQEENRLLRQKVTHVSICHISCKKNLPLGTAEVFGLGGSCPPWCSGVVSPSGHFG